MAFEEEGVPFEGPAPQQQDTLPAYDDPDLIEAQAAIESSNNPRAVGKLTKWGRAQGYLQMIPETFKRYSEEGADVFDKEANIKARNKYMKALVEKFGGDTRLALAGYNWGENRDILENAKSYEEVKDKIPTEVRDYVSKIEKVYQKKKSSKSRNKGRADEEEVLDMARESTAEQEPILNYPPPRKPTKLDDQLQYNDTLERVRRAQFAQDKPGPVGTKAEFAKKMLPIVSSPEYDTLTEPEKLEVLSKVYTSQYWDDDTAALVKSHAESIYEGMTPEEYPNIEGLVQTLAPPLRLSTESESDTAAAIEKWKGQSLANIRKYIKPELLGNRLDQYFDEVKDIESAAAIDRNRSMTALAFNRSGHVARDVFTGFVRVGTDPAAQLARLVTGPFSPEMAQKVGDSIAALPDILGKPAKDYLFKTDDTGHLILDPVTGKPIPWLTSQISQGVGTALTFVTGGAFLRLGVAAKTLGMRGISPLAAKTVLGGVGTLMQMEAGYKESEAEGGRPDQNLVAGILNAPPGAAMSFGLISIGAGAPPALAGLNRINAARTLAAWYVKDAAGGGVLMSGAQLAQSAAVSAVLGRDVYSKDKQIAAALMGVIGTGVAKGVEGYGAVKSAIKQNADIAKLKAEEAAAIKEATEREAARRTEVQKSMSPAEWGNLAAALQKLQLSPSSSIKITNDTAKSIIYDPRYRTLLEALHITPVPDEAGGYRLIRDSTYVRSEARNNIAEVNGLINTVSKLLRKAVSPDGYEGLKRRLDDLNVQSAKAESTYGTKYMRLAEERQSLLKQVEKAKAIYEDTDIKGDRELKKIAKEDLRTAEQNLTDFDDKHTKFYDKGFETIGKIQDEIVDIKNRLKEATNTETPYINNIGEMQNDLADLMQLRHEYTQKASREEAKAAKEKLQTMQAEEEQQALNFEQNKAKIREENANAIFERRILLNELGYRGVPETEALSKGLNIDGTYVVRSSNNKWYAVQEDGTPISKGHDFIYDVIEGINNKFELPKMVAEETIKGNPELQARVDEWIKANPYASRGELNDWIKRELLPSTKVPLPGETVPPIEAGNILAGVKNAFAKKLTVKGIAKKTSGSIKKKVLKSELQFEDGKYNEYPIIETKSFIYITDTKHENILAGPFSRKLAKELLEEVPYRDIVNQYESLKSPVKSASPNIAGAAIGAEEAQPKTLTEALEGVRQGVSARTIPISSTSIDLTHYAGPNKGKVITSDFTEKKEFPRSNTKPIAVSSLFKAAQRVANMLSKVGTPILRGGVIPRHPDSGKRYLGFFSPHKNYIKIGSHTDVQTLLHEVTHDVVEHLVNKGSVGNFDFSHLPPEVLVAARDQAETFYPAGTMDELTLINEGFANFFEHYTAQLPVRKTLLNWYHGQFKQQFPEVYKAMENLKTQAYDYYNQSPQAYTLGRLVKPESTATKVIRKFTTDNFIASWVNRAAILKQVSEAVARDFETHYNRAYPLSSNLIRGPRMSDFLGNDIHGPNLLEIWKSAGNKGDLLKAYLVDARALAIAGKNIEPGVALKLAQDNVDNIKAKHPEIVKLAKAYYDWLDNVHLVLAQMGPQSAWAVSKMRYENARTTGAEHGYWVPFQREGHNFVSSLKPLKGSTKAIIDPTLTIEAAITNMFQTGLKQRTLAAIMEEASSPRVSATGYLVREVTGGQRQGLMQQLKERSKTLFKDMNESESMIDSMNAYLLPEYEGVSGKDFRVYALMDGRKIRFFEMDPKIMKAMDNALPDFTNNVLFKALWRYPAAILRPLATTYSAAFQVRNTVRDLATAWRFLETSGLGAKDAAQLMAYYAASVKDQLLYHAGKANEGWYSLFNRLGVTHSTKYGTERELYRTLSPKSSSKLIELSDVTFNKLTDILSFTENATRAAATRMFMEQKLGVKNPNQVLTPLQSAEAIWFYKNVTTNFQKQGSIARVVNMWVPFFTARIAEYSRLPGDFKRNPGKMAAIAAGSLAYGFYHALAHDDVDWYKEMNPQQKMQSITFEITQNGVKKVMFLPLDSWTGLHWGLGQAIGNLFMKDPNLKPGMVELAKAYFKGVSPINHPADLLGIPIKEYVQQESNRDFYFNRSIVPPNLEYQHPALQFSEMSSELAKRVGALAGISPLRLDHAIRSTLPAVSGYLTFTDRMLGYKKAQENQSYNFIVNSLTRAGGASAILDKSQEAFTDALLKYRYNKVDETPEEGEIRKALEKVNRNISDAKAVLTAKLSAEDRDAIRKTIKKELTNGLNIARGAVPAIATTSGLHPEAQQVRKEREGKMKTELQKRKQALGLTGALKGNTE